MGLLSLWSVKRWVLQQATCPWHLLWTRDESQRNSHFFHFLLSNWCMMLLDWIVFSGTVPQFFGASGISCRNFKLLFNNSSTPQPFHISDIFWQTIKQQRFCNLKAVCLLFSFSLSTSKVESSIFFPQLPRSDFYHILSSCTSQFWIYYILNQRGVQFLKFTADWVMYQRRPRHSAWFQTVSFCLKGKWTVLKSCHIEKNKVRGTTYQEIDSMTWSYLIDSKWRNLDQF